MKDFLKTLLAAFVGSIVALFVCGIFLFAMIGSIAALSESNIPIVPSSAILKIDLQQPVTEQSIDDPIKLIQSFNLNSSRTIGILPFVQAINNAATDPAIKFIYLNPNSMNIGMAQLEEVRNALVKFRLSGKPIIAYANNYSPGSYYLASVADKVYMNSQGSAVITGISSGLFFFKDLLDKLGIQVQLIRHGKYKAAGEMFISNTISPANKEQNQVLISSIWDSWIEDISKSRNVSTSDINNAINNLELGTPQSMINMNLIDGSLTRLELIDKICTLFEVDKEKDLKVISIYNYIKATAKSNYKIKNKIAVLFADGEIIMEGEGIAAKEFVPIISKIKSDSTIKAVVLRVNSPGGDAQAAEMINNELQALRKNKPLIVSFSNYAASGGYWISAQSDKIYSDKSTITGSIGVFSMFFNAGNALKKHLNVNTVSINSNTHADMFSGVRPLDDSEQKYMENFVEDIYSQFTNLVATGRKLDTSYVDTIGQGRVWSGINALDIKLVDEIGGLQDAIDYCSNTLSLNNNYRIVTYPKQKNTVEQLLNMMSDTQDNIKSLTDPFALIQRSYSSIKDFNGTKNYARLPYIYEMQY
jgi:signal peptide peptidase SppA, 67K type